MSSTALAAAASDGGSPTVVDPDAAMGMVEQGGFHILDVRTEKEYDMAHVTKPARCSTNIQFMTGRDLSALQKNPEFVQQIQGKFRSTDSKLLIMCKSGKRAAAAQAELMAAGYTSCVVIEGGYDAWGKVWTPSGKRVVAGVWVPSGTEALKSGLMSGAASTYEEGASKDGQRLQP